MLENLHPVLVFLALAISLGILVPLGAGVVAILGFCWVAIRETRRPRGGFTPKQRGSRLWLIAPLMLALAPLPAANLTGCALYDVGSAAHGQQEVSPSQAWYAAKSDLLSLLDAASLVVSAGTTPQVVKATVAAAVGPVPEIVEAGDAALREFEAALALGDDSAAEVALASLRSASTLARGVVEALAAHGIVP